MEIFKINYEFLLVIMMGGAVSWLYSQYAFEQEGRERKKELQRKFQSDLIEAYNSSKRIRRLLRAEARCTILNANVTAIKADPYSELMLELMEVQLKFEYLKRQVINTDLFGELSDLGDLNLHLNSIENYLHDIITEYEKSYDSFHEDGLSPMERLPLLSEFIYSPAEHKQIAITDNFMNRFKIPADNAMEQMLKILVR